MLVEGDGQALQVGEQIASQLIDGALGHDLGGAVVDVGERGVEQGDRQRGQRYEHEQGDAVRTEVGPQVLASPGVREQHGVEDELQRPRHEQGGDDLAQHGGGGDDEKTTLPAQVRPQRPQDR